MDSYISYISETFEYEKSGGELFFSFKYQHADITHDLYITESGIQQIIDHYLSYCFFQTVKNKEDFHQGTITNSRDI